MKTVLFLFLMLACFLTSCATFREMAYDQATKVLNEKVIPIVEQKVTAEIKDKAPDLLAKLDTNKDQKISLEELRGTDLKDPTTIMLVINFLLTAFGIKRASDANKAADALYDVTHAPVAAGK